MSEPPPPGWVPPGDPGPPPPGWGTTGQAPSFGPPPPDWAPDWAAPVHRPGVVALRPLGLGDFFDGAFATIRRNPSAMVGLAAAVITLFMVVPVLITLLLAGTGRLDLGLFGAPASGASAELSDVLDQGAVSLVANLGSLFAAAATVILNGMLVHVVAEAVLGRRTGIGAAWQAVRGRLLRLFGLTLLNGLMVLVVIAVPVTVGVLMGVRLGVGEGFLVGVPLLLVALVLLAFVQVRFFQLAAPVLVLERAGVIASLRRAGVLSRGQFWRLLGIYLLTTLVAGVVGYVIAMPLGLVGVAGAALLPGTSGSLVLIFSSYLTQILVGAVTTPFTSGVVALQYVDQRIRKEGLDVQLIAASQPAAGIR